MRIVLDTHVLISGLLTPFGPGGEIVRMIFAGHLTLCIDARIISEYREVLYRPKFNFNGELIETLLGHVDQNAVFISALPITGHLPDIDDEPFLEVAMAGKADCLITGNIAHFPPPLRQGITVLTPNEFLEFFIRPDLKATDR
jgi:uncharacterized protein